VKRFGYWRDPLAVASVLLYAINRWALKPWVHHGFWHDHFNDLLLIPAALPLVLWLQRRLKLRLHDRPPTWPEIALHLVVWTAICEWIGPRFYHHATADWRDVAAYTAGAIAAGLWWHWSANRTDAAGWA